MLSQCGTHRNGEHSVVLGNLLFECSLGYQFIWNGSGATLQTSAEKNSGSGVFLLILFFYSQNLAVFVVDDVLKAYNTFFRGGWAGRVEFRLLFVRSL